jgi:hypothetical protein
MDLLDQASGILSEGGVVLWVRSGTKSKDSAVDSVEQVLKPENAARAREFGERIGGRIGKVASAPGDTSVLTARAIFAGAGRAGGTVDEDREIGDPSAFICDFEACEATYSGRGLSQEQKRDHLLNAVLRTRAAWACEDPREAAALIEKKLVSMMQPGKISVCVSPSVAIALYAACALGLEENIAHADCPGFLEGAVVWRGDEGKVMVGLGRHRGPSRL